MALVSPTGDLVTVNASFCVMVGYDADVLQTMHIRDITHPDDVQNSLELMQSLGRPAA
ncbi:MAG: hypothetical protein JWN68_1543 [Nocardioides sp.]|jgi:PAS domain S-box-containing protein|nr:hypothetical protein [Nocardioides sp.]